MRKIFLIAALFIISAITTAAQTAPTPQPIRAAAFGLQTLEAGRTTRLSIVHAPPLTTPSPTGAPVRYAVRADFDFYSVRTDGSVRFVRRLSREATLAAGDGLTLDYTPAASENGGRIASTVYVQRLGETQNPDIAPAVNVSLEIRTREGTLFLLPGTIRGFNPQPDPPRELLGGNQFD